MKKLLLAAAISALCVSAFAQGKDLKVAIDATYEPFTFKTADGKLAAHFEHTIAITPNGPVILTKV